MSVRANIIDGESTSRAVGVTSRNALKVSTIPLALSDISNDILTSRKLFRGQLTDAAGSSDMNVDGSTTPVEFSLKAQPGRVLAIDELRLVFNGENLEMDTNDFRRFGDATSANAALPNGVEIEVDQGGVITSLVVSPVVRMGDFYNYIDDVRNIKNAITAQSDFLSFDFRFATAIVLPEGSIDRILIRINDDLTPIDLLTCFARGAQEVL